MLEHVKIPLLPMEQMPPLADLEKHPVTNVARRCVSARQAEINGWIK